MKNATFPFIDLIAGRGMEQAGFTSSFANEILNFAADEFVFNAEAQRMRGAA